MFDIIPNLLSSIITFLFPIFASYKALRTSDPAQLTPWLMYWVVLSCFSLVESWTWFILSWLPFYAYFRLFLLSYLVLPQTQGARFLYQTHIHPLLAQYESEIDSFITNAHDRLKSMGLSSFKRFIDFVKENILGLPPRAPPPSVAPEFGSYAQTLLSRFNLPSARQGLAAPAGDFYGLLTTALGQVGSASGGQSREAQAEEMMSRSGTLIPQGLTSTADKMSFLATQRERLSLLLSALDKEASGLEKEDFIQRDVVMRLRTPPQDHNGQEELKKSKSEAEFETVESEDWSGARLVSGAGGLGKWMPWGWGGQVSSSPGSDADGKKNN